MRGHSITMMRIPTLKQETQPYVTTSTVYMNHQQKPTNELKKIHQSENMNHFERLPDDLIVRHIFNKIPDAQSLFMCSLVSKHFVSLIFDMRTVPLHVPDWIPACNCHRDPASASLFRRLLHFLGKPFRRLLRYPFRPRNDHDEIILQQTGVITNFLKKFSCIEFLNVHVDFSGSKTANFEPLIRWKFDRYGFIYLSAKDFVVRGDAETVGIENDEVIITRAEEVGAQLYLIHYHFLDALVRFVFVEEMVRFFQDLKCVVVRDCLKQGVAVLDEKLIAKMRINGESAFRNDSDFPMKLWHLPLVKLPLSSSSGSGCCVVKEATFFLLKLDKDIEDGLMAENAFQEKEFRKLAMAVVKKDPCSVVNFPRTEVS